MRYIRNAHLVLENGILWDGVLVMDGDRIAAYGPEREIKIPENAEVIDAKGLYVGPGFVSIHVHGGGGLTFVTEPEKTVRYFLERGDTTVCPTLYYDLAKDDFVKAIKDIKAAKESSDIGSAVGGFYMEGPYMNPKFGVMPDQNKWKGPIVPEMYEEMVDEAGTMVKVWAIAPERPGLEPFLKYAKKVNPDVVFSVGHSEAKPEEIRRLKRCGIRLQTHCMDATGRIETFRGTRASGPDEYCLSDSDIYVEIICDSLGVHVNPDLIRMILAAKGLDKIVLVTDTFVNPNEAPEMPKGLEHVKDILFDNNGDLSGSRLTMAGACKNMMMHTNCGIAQVFLMAARNPARVIGMEDEIGTIEVGKKANLVLVDDRFRVDTVIFEGEILK